MKQAFLQVQIKQEERNALRFHWVKDLESKQVETVGSPGYYSGSPPLRSSLGEWCNNIWIAAVQNIQR